MNIIGVDPEDSESPRGHPHGHVAEERSGSGVTVRDTEPVAYCGRAATVLAAATSGAGRTWDGGELGA